MVQSNPESLERVREVLKKNPRGLNIQAIAAKCGINRKGSHAGQRYCLTGPGCHHRPDGHSLH